MIRRPSIISFDLDGTLVNDRFTTAVWERAVPLLYARKIGLPLDEATRHVMSQYGLIGEGSLEWYDLKYWLRRFALGIDCSELLGASKDEIEAYPEANEVLRTIGRCYPMVILTNAVREFSDIELKVSGLDRHFYKVFSATSDFGIVKKDACFYERVCQNLKLAPDDIVHIGDHVDFDYQAAKSAGIQSYLVDRSGKHTGDHVLKSLKELPARLALSEC